MEKYQKLNEEIEELWRVEAGVVPEVIRALSAGAPKIKAWFQRSMEQTQSSVVVLETTLGLKTTF